MAVRHLDQFRVSLLGWEDFSLPIESLRAFFPDISQANWEHIRDSLFTSIMDERFRLGDVFVPESPLRKRVNLKQIKARILKLKYMLTKIQEEVAKMPSPVRAILADSSFHFLKIDKHSGSVASERDDGSFYKEYSKDTMRDVGVHLVTSTVNQETVASILYETSTDPVMSTYVVKLAVENCIAHIEKSEEYLKRSMFRPKRGDLASFVSELAAVWVKATGQEPTLSSNRGKFLDFCCGCHLAAIPPPQSGNTRQAPTREDLSRAAHLNKAVPYVVRKVVERRRKHAK